MEVKKKMNKLIIKGKAKSKDTITRTIRFSGSDYDKICEIAEKYNISFNNVVNQLISFAIKNLD